MTPGTRRSSIRIRLSATLLPAALLAVLLVAGCWDAVRAVTIRNQTEAPLMFGVILADGTEFHFTYVVSPGEDFSLTIDSLYDNRMGVDGCTLGDLIAYGPDGQEVARHPPPLCLDGKRGPNTWDVTAPLGNS